MEKKERETNEAEGFDIMGKEKESYSKNILNGKSIAKGNMIFARKNSIY